MCIMKNEIPILEFDSSVDAVIMPDHERLALRLPTKAVFAFLGDQIDAYARLHACRQVSAFVSATKSYPVYTTVYRGETILSLIHI